MQPLRGFLAAFILLMASGRMAESADIRSQNMPDGKQAIVLSGTIVPGDETAFHALAGTALAGTLGRVLVITTGPGGSVRPAIIIGSEIRARGWSTLVPGGSGVHRRVQ